MSVGFNISLTLILDHLNKSVPRLYNESVTGIKFEETCELKAIVLGVLR